MCMNFSKPLNLSGPIGVWTQIIKVLSKELGKNHPCPRVSYDIFEEGGSMRKKKSYKYIPTTVAFFYYLELALLLLSRQ